MTVPPVPETLWRPAQARPDDATARIAEAILAGTGGAVLPPVVRTGPGGVWRFDHHVDDPGVIAAALADPVFAAWADLLARLDAWCHGPVTLSAFAPLLREVFTACALGRAPDPAAEFAAATAAMGLFLRRLDRDLRTAWPREPRLAGPVLSVEARDGETHNHRQRVLRLRMAGGASVAYKPRPAGCEDVFAAPRGSVFSLINRVSAGAVRLPVFRTWRGRGRDRRAYSWSEWIEPGPQGVLLAEDGEELRGTVLSPERAGTFWRRAGELTAVAHAFGLSDLIAGNLLVGGDEPLYYPVDLEVVLNPGTLLAATGLVDDGNGGTHHVGLENTARWCGVDGPLAAFLPGAGLVRRRSAWGEPDSRTVVADTEGRLGYGPYAPAFVRGMFDTWILMCRYREELAARLGRDFAVRVLLRATGEYTDALDDGRPGDWTPAEAAQLARGDIPYFFRSANGGPLLTVDGPAGEAPPGLPPDALVRAGGRLDLSGLGIALRDAITYAAPGEMSGHGVRVTPDSAVIDWPEAGRTFMWTWSAESVRLHTDLAAGELSARLLRLDRLDTPLRVEWTDGGFTDTALAEKLRALTDEGMALLADLDDWPTPGWVGTAASEAACRLVQHAEGHRELRERCLARMTAAMERGELPGRDVAYTTDALRVSEGRPQVYGTKFTPVDGVLVPLPIEEPGGVDERRAAMGLGTLAEYTDVIRNRFGTGGTTS